MLRDIVDILRADRRKAASEVLGLLGLCAGIVGALVLPVFA